MVKVGIINVTGYAGAELARLLYNHPEAEVASVTGRSAAGKKLAGIDDAWDRLRGRFAAIRPGGDPQQLVAADVPNGRDPISQQRARVSAPRHMGGLL